MSKTPQNLKNFSNPQFDRGASALKYGVWYIVNSILFKTGFPISGIKVTCLRLFGAKVGKGVVIKPNVNIKFPWKLEIGNDVWIGEKVWVDNLDKVQIADNVCISQGAMLLCGNHNYKKSSFDLITAPIVLESGVWICAKATVGPGVICQENSILSPNSFANKSLEKDSVYMGVPAQKVKARF